MNNKRRNAVVAVVILGLIVLYSFPSPQENFALYALTALIFAIAVVVLVRRK